MEIVDQYKKNFLSQVIFRIDFDKVDIGKLNRFYSTNIKRIFPLKSKHDVLENNIELALNTNLVTNSQNPINVWNFLTDQKDKLLSISNSFLYIQYTNLSYSNSENLLELINTIVNPFLLEFKIGAILRTGLRYTNEIPKQKSDWSEYINPILVSSFGFAKSVNLELARNMAQIVSRFENSLLNFQYGIWNQDYPNKIAKQEYILDFDISSILPVYSRDIDLSDLIKKYRLEIRKLFEACISDEFRLILNEETEK